MGELHEKRKSSKKKEIGELYDPHEVEQRHLTSTDEEIKIVDIPERYQTRKFQLQHAEEVQLENEAKWIFENYFRYQSISIQNFDRKDLLKLNYFDVKSRLIVSKIISILDFIRNRHYDIMFIANYRKEHISPEIITDDLYWILKFDEYWNQNMSKKKSLITLTRNLQCHLYDKIRKKPDVILNDELRIIQDDDIKRIEKASSNDELNDISQLLFLYYGQEMIIMRNNSISLDIDSFSDGKVKRQSSRRNYYSLCKNFGFNSLASKFGLTPEQFGENLRESYQVHEPEQFPVEPEEASQEYVAVNSPFKTPNSVLSGARHIVALQISHDPQIRSYFRSVFRKRAKVFVYPTKKGCSHIAERHYCAKFKYLRGKPVTDFMHDDFLMLIQAEEQNLINIKISLDEDEHNLETDRNKLQTCQNNQRFFDEIKHLYLRDDYSSVVVKWNDQRIMALESALYNHLYPFISKEIKFILKVEAERHVILACMSKMEQYLDVSPCISFKKSISTSSCTKIDSDHSILACSLPSDIEAPGYIVELDQNGEVVSYSKLHFINKYFSNTSRVTQDAKIKDFALIKKMILSSRPRLFVLPAITRSVTYIQEEVKDIIQILQSDTELDTCVEILDISLSNLCSQSFNIVSEFPDYPIQLRHAISLGRRAQDPLTEYATLAINPEDLTCLPLHSLQAHISNDELTDALHFEVCKIISNVGVDINSCLKYEHKSCLLNYIPGLGPRKASAILKKLQQDGSILENRSQLITICEVGPTVFLNCAAFIKVDVNYIREKGSGSYIEDLDASRVHPETYDWAKKMAVDALEYDDTIENFDSTVAVQRILENPDRLRELDLDAFAVQLEKENFGDKRATLYDIRSELELGCYEDRRKSYQRLNQTELFDLIFDDALAANIQKVYARGNIVNCKVTSIVRKKSSQDQYAKINPERSEETGKWKCPYCRVEFAEFSLFWTHCDEGLCPGEPIGIKTMLENGLTGFIHIKNISSQLVLNLESRVRIGMTVTCRILDVNYEKFSLFLSSKSTDLQDSESKFSVKKDQYYDFEKERFDLKHAVNIDEKNKISSIKRVLVHPKFKNVTYQESLLILEKLYFGDCIIRPSSRGINRLTLSWKIAEDVYQHIDIVEKNKPNDFTIGKSLFINDKEFEDLDEILAVYLNKMVILLKELRGHKSFKEPLSDQKNRIEHLLILEKTTNPSRIPYFISPAVNLPGKFILAYLPRKKSQFDYFSINPIGLKYRGQCFESFSQLLKWFKDHYFTTFSNKSHPHVTNTVVNSPSVRPPNVNFIYNDNNSGNPGNNTLRSERNENSSRLRSIQVSKS